jgi:hypothetical protein
MRTLALLLLLCYAAIAQPPLTVKDEIDIRAAIEEQARKDNQKRTPRVWSERGPLIYRVRKIEPLTADVAIGEADGDRMGPFGEHYQYLFVVTHAGGRWTVARRVQVCNGPGPVKIQPLTER